MQLLKAISLMSVLLTVCASAENRFCIGGDIQHLTVAEKSTCQAKLNMIRSAAAQDSSLTDWHFVVVCKDSDWTDYAAFSSRPADELADASADTDVAKRSIFFRGARLAGSSDAASVLLATEIKKMAAPQTNVLMASGQ